MSLTEFERHVLGRLTGIEEEVRILREVTWPVCQGLVDQKTGPFDNMQHKRKFFKFLDLEIVKILVRLKARFMGMSQDVASEELRQVLVEAPREGG